MEKLLTAVQVTDSMNRTIKIERKQLRKEEQTEKGSMRSFHSEPDAEIRTPKILKEKPFFVEDI